jgi:low affinity Fe/Cu permease
MASEPARNGSWAYRLGCVVSDRVSDTFAHPYAQIAFLVVCVAWFAAGWNVNILTAALSIIAITLTQMVLNSQNEREIDDHRRDVAMHAKLDELIAANRSAKNEFVGIEEREEQEIVHLKEEVQETIERVSADTEQRGAATADKGDGGWRRNTPEERTDMSK